MSLKQDIINAQTPLSHLMKQRTCCVLPPLTQALEHLWKGAQLPVNRKDKRFKLSFRLCVSVFSHHDSFCWRILTSTGLPPRFLCPEWPLHPNPHRPLPGFVSLLPGSLLPAADTNARARNTAPTPRWHTRQLPQHNRHPAAAYTLRLRIWGGTR